MKFYGTKRAGPISLQYALGNFPHPTLMTWWEDESMGLALGIGNGHADDIVAVCIEVPRWLVRCVNRLAGYPT